MTSKTIDYFRVTWFATDFFTFMTPQKLISKFGNDACFGSHCMSGRVLSVNVVSQICVCRKFVETKVRHNKFVHVTNHVESTFVTVTQSGKSIRFTVSNCYCIECNNIQYPTKSYGPPTAFAR